MTTQTPQPSPPPFFLPDTGREIVHARSLIYTLIAAAFTEPQTERFALLRQPAFQSLVQTAAEVLDAKAAEEQWQTCGPGEATPAVLPVRPALDALRLGEAPYDQPRVQVA
jgi:hypothetical protein